MHQKRGHNKIILITGGTSGLGLELVRIFLHEGFKVIATGQKQIDINGSPGEFLLYNVDFGDLRQVAETAREICRSNAVSLIINNAGILSPPSYTETKDGLECTFQINFLAHLLTDEIIMQSAGEGLAPTIVSVISPVYRFAGSILMPGSDATDYSPLRAYSSSKLYLAMMHQFLISASHHEGIHYFSFDPGTFSSSIHRMQKNWFKKMYQIASPFMRSPARVAKVLANLILNENTENGMIYDSSKKKKELPRIDKSQTDTFTRRCYELLDPFLK